MGMMAGRQCGRTALPARALPQPEAVKRAGAYTGAQPPVAQRCLIYAGRRQRHQRRLLPGRPPKRAHRWLTTHAAHANEQDTKSKASAASSMAGRSSAQSPLADHHRGQRHDHEQQHHQHHHQQRRRDRRDRKHLTLRSARPCQPRHRQPRQLPRPELVRAQHAVSVQSGQRAGAYRLEVWRHVVHTQRPGLLRPAPRSQQRLVAAQLRAALERRRQAAAAAAAHNPASCAVVERHAAAPATVAASRAFKRYAAALAAAAHGSARRGRRREVPTLVAKAGRRCAASGALRNVDAVCSCMRGVARGDGVARVDGVGVQRRCKQRKHAVRLRVSATRAAPTGLRARCHCRRVAAAAAAAVAVWLVRQASAAAGGAAAADTAAARRAVEGRQVVQG
mmetsp:Transcript_39484/g.117447  ORF Transcript_39484/g.117447 Transcript_39484/m.117447 type:complete len:393 (+) Transcript_39484:282-1460(+)